MSFGDGDLHVANRRLREHIARLEDKVDSLKDVNGDLCREINRQERRIRDLESLVRDMHAWFVGGYEYCQTCEQRDLCDSYYADDCPMRGVFERRISELGIGVAR